MANPGSPAPAAVPIGDIATPVFARLPEPSVVFAMRAARFRHLANAHGLERYLLFLAALAEIQHGIQGGLAEPELPDPDALARARQFAMPPIDRNRFLIDPAMEAALEGLLASARDMHMPEAASAALARVIDADEAARHLMLRAVLSDAIPADALAEHGFVAAALQVHFARLASRLDARSLGPVGDGVCPCCGAPPVTSMVVGWQGADGARYCACSLCATLWNYVRIKCTLCGSTKSISYKEIAGGQESIKAETCGVCNGYVKILHQHKDHAVDPVADDVASLGLDLLMREDGFRRGGFNPFLIGM